MSLYNRAGANPMAGCIPALLQLPVFYALFTFSPLLLNCAKRVSFGQMTCLLMIRSWT